MSWTWTGWTAQVTVLVSSQTSTLLAVTCAGLITCGNGIVLPFGSTTPLLVSRNWLYGWPLITSCLLPTSKLNTRSAVGLKLSPLAWFCCRNAVSACQLRLPIWLIWVLSGGPVEDATLNARIGYSWSMQVGG